jgi:hypothetical protein
VTFEVCSFSKPFGLPDGEFLGYLHIYGFMHFKMNFRISDGHDLVLGTYQIAATLPSIGVVGVEVLKFVQVKVTTQFTVDARQ